MSTSASTKRPSTPAESTQAAALPGLRRDDVLLYLGVVVLYLYFFPYFEGLNSPADNSRLYMVKAIVDHGTFAVDEVLGGLYQPIADFSQHDGKLYSCRAPGTSFLGVPFYFVLSQLGPLSKLEEMYFLRLFVGTLPSLVFLFYVFRFLARFSAVRYFRQLVFVGLAIGSMCFTYSLAIHGHQQAAIGLFGGFMALYENRLRKRDSAGLLLLAGFLLAFGVSCEYQIVLGALCLFGYGLVAVKKRPLFLWVVLGALPPTILTAMYHYWSFGSVFQTGHHYLVNKTYLDYQQHGYKGLFYFTWDGFFGTFFSPANGLFFYAPWLLFFLPGLWATFATKRFRVEAVCIALVTLSSFVIVPSVYAWKAGWTVGPRYLCAIVPFLVIPILLWLDRYKRSFRYSYYVFVPLLVVSVLIYATSSVIFPHFPERLHNPFFELLVPMLRHSYYPRSVSSLLGLTGLVSALGYFVVLALVLGAVVTRYRDSGIDMPLIERRLPNLLIVATSVTFLLLLQSMPRTADPELVRKAHRYVRSIWEPPLKYRR